MSSLAHVSKAGCAALPSAAGPAGSDTGGDMGGGSPGSPAHAGSVPRAGFAPREQSHPALPTKRFASRSAPEEAAHWQRHRGDYLPRREHAVCPGHDRLQLLARLHRGAGGEPRGREHHVQGEGRTLPVRPVVQPVLQLTGMYVCVLNIHMDIRTCIFMYALLHSVCIYIHMCIKYVHM